MNLGTLAVLLGLVLVVIDVFIPGPTDGRFRRGTLLHVGVILIGVGVLIGVDAIHT